MQGYIKLHRQIIENEFYFSERFTKSQAWVDLLLLANFKPNTIFIRGIEVKTNPGELCYSQLSLSKRWKWNIKTVNKFLLMLENRKMVTIKITKVTTIITILNWNQYQGNGEQNGEQKENKTDTNKNDKECKYIINENFSKERIQEMKNESLNKLSENNIKYINESTINKTVEVFAKIRGAENPENADYGFIKSMLKVKAGDEYKPDGLNEVRKCLILLYLLNIYAEKLKGDSKFRYTYFKTVYSSAIYSEYRKKIFDSYTGEKRIIKNISTNEGDYWK